MTLHENEFPVGEAVVRSVLEAQYGTGAHVLPHRFCQLAGATTTVHTRA